MSYGTNAAESPERSRERMLELNQATLFLGGTSFGPGLRDLGDGFWGDEVQTTGFQRLWFTDPDTGLTVAGQAFPDLADGN